MDVVGVMAAYLPVVRVCTALSREAPPCDPKHVGAILNIFKYFIIIVILSVNYIFVHLLDNKVFESSLMHGTNMKIPETCLFRHYHQSFQRCKPVQDSNLIMLLSSILLSSLRQNLSISYIPVACLLADSPSLLLAHLPDSDQHYSWLL